MSSQLFEAFTMLGIGMVTVFLVLSLVFLTGKLLITVVNTMADNQHPNEDEIAPEIIAVLNAAVELTTSGKGRITKIEKKSH